MRILRTATEVGALLFVPALVGILVARDLADELRYRRWARKYRREHPGPGSDLRFAYVAELRREQGMRAAGMESARAVLTHPVHHA